MHRCVDISPVFASFPSAVQWTQSPYNSPIFVIVITLIAFNSVATNTYYKHDELTAACTIKCACVCASGAEGSSQYDEMGWHDGVQHTQDEHHARRQIPMMVVRQKMLPEFLASEAGAVNSLMLLNIIARYYIITLLCVCVHLVRMFRINIYAPRPRALWMWRRRRRARGELGVLGGVGLGGNLLRNLHWTRSNWHGI